MPTKAQFIRAETSEVYARAAQLILQAAIASRTLVNLLLPGGRTVQGVCKSLLDQAHLFPAAFPKFHIWELDAFASTPERPETNRDVITRCFVQPAIAMGILAMDQFHPMDILDDPDSTVAAYDLQIGGMGDITRICLLGAGGGEFRPGEPDYGHVGGIFGGHKYSDIWTNGHRYAVVKEAPKDPLLRYAATPSYICESDYVFGVLTTLEKQNALKAYLDGMKPMFCPFAMVDWLTHGKAYVLTDIPA